MTAMYTRRMARPIRSFFLFGPRGTGKSTWLRHVLPGACWYDLLHSEVYLRLLADPSEFRREIDALPAGTWVVVDEYSASRLSSTKCTRSWRAIRGVGSLLSVDRARAN